MSSSYGQNVKITIFGQSHSKAIGMTLEGIPAGTVIDFDELDKFMQRRAPGRNAYSTPRAEGDKPKFICGVVGNTTCGTPITAIIENNDCHSSDYEILKKIPRPGHADYTAEIKYAGNQDYAGGGHFSGRMTAPLCIGGGIAKQILEDRGIQIITRIKSIGTVEDNGELVTSTADKEFPVVDDNAGVAMREYIASKSAEGDSVGGVIECVVLGMPVGVGDPMFDGMENRIAAAVFGIPAVKGIEFGNGFEASLLTGSENNDPFVYENGEVKTLSNNCGGILGGITNGMPLQFRVAFKPTPSIAKEQRSINLETGENTVLSVPGRHDPCIVPRAVPCVEAAAALAIYDAVK